MIQKQNYYFPANLRYKPRVLIAANNNAYRTLRNKTFAVFLSININKPYMAKMNHMRTLRQAK